MIKKPNITEGEWVSEGDTVCIDYSDKPLDHVAGCAKMFYEAENRSRKNEIEANAKAISAVPEMIDALIGIYNLSTSYFDFGKEAPPEFKGEMQAWGKGIDLVEQALKKAGCEFNGEPND